MQGNRKARRGRHLNSIFQKLDALDRTHAVTIAIRRGLLHYPLN